MLFKDIGDNCKEECPLYGEFCSGGMVCYGGAPVEPPCVVFSDIEDADELYDQLSASQRRFEDQEDRRIRAEERKKALNAEKARKAREARSVTYAETTQIKNLRKRIEKNEKLLSMAKSRAMAINITNEMFGYKERVNVKADNPIESENKRLLAEIERLEAIRKEKLKRLRESRKM